MQETTRRITAEFVFQVVSMLNQRLLGHGIQEWIHQVILKNDSKQSDGIRATKKKKTRDCLECKVLPSCKVGAQTDKNCTSY